MRPFADILRELAGGVAYDDLTAGLAEVVSAVMATRKAGEITLKLSVRANGENSVSISDDIKVKVPKPPRGLNIFFATADGSLVRNDPRQGDLPLRRIEEKPPGDLKTA